VIRFKCIYCGQRILAPDGGAGKRGKCPKCTHLLVVPDSTKGRPAISPNKEPMPDQPKPRVPEWCKEPGGFDGIDAKDAWAELYKESFGFLIPTYDKLSIFLMAVTWILLYAVNNHLRGKINAFIAEAHEYPGWRATLIILIFAAVLIIVMFLLFTRREKAEFGRPIMLWFAIATNVFTGIVASVYVLKNTDVRNWQLVFPIWNIINACLLYLMLVLNLIDEECIIDRKATLLKIVFGLASVIIIVLICDYAFKLHWAITFSICIVYTTSFDRAIQNVFPGLTGQEFEGSRDKV
jgi:hypothetical protein